MSETRSIFLQLCLSQSFTFLCLSLKGPQLGLYVLYTPVGYYNTLPCTALNYTISGCIEQINCMSNLSPSPAKTLLFSSLSQAQLGKGKLLFNSVELELDPDFILHVKFTIFWLNKGLRVYLDLHVLDFPKNTS